MFAIVIAFNVWKHMGTTQHIQVLKNRMLDFLKKELWNGLNHQKEQKEVFVINVEQVYFFKIIGAKTISIAAGMFNRPVKLKTTMNIFVKGKSDYYKLDSRMPKFNRYPK